MSSRPKISSSQTFLLLKLTEVTSTKVSVKRFSYRQIPWLTSLLSTLTAKKFMKMKFSADKIYYNFSQKNSKVTNMQNFHRRQGHFKMFPRIAFTQLNGPSQLKTSYISLYYITVHLPYYLLLFTINCFPSSPFFSDCM